MLWLGSIKRARAPWDTLARLVVRTQIGYIAYKLQNPHSTITNSLNAVKELPANPCFPFMQ